MSARMDQLGSIPGISSVTPWTPPAGLLGWWAADNTATVGLDVLWLDLVGSAHAVLAGVATIGADGLTVAGAGWAEKPATAGAYTWAFWQMSPTYGNLRTLIGCDSAVLTDLNSIDMRAGPALSQVGVVPAAITLGVWSHVAFVTSQDGLYVTSYKNGVAIATAATATSYRRPLKGTQFGRSGPTLGRPWRGTISDIQAYGPSLSADDIADIYANSPWRHAA